MPKKLKRILHIFGGMNVGGAEIFIMNVFRRIDRKKIIFEFAVNTHEECFFDEEIKKLGGKIYHLSAPSKVGIPAWKKDFKSILKKYGPFEVVHSHVHFFSGFVMQVAKKNKVPIRITHSHLCDKVQFFNIARIIYREIAKRLILKNSTSLVACAKDAGKNLFGKDIRQKIIHNGVDLGSYFDKKSNVVRKFKNNTHGKIFGHIGRFEKQKNHKFLIEIFFQIKKTLPNAKLILVGKGILLPKIKKIVKDKNLEASVKFTGVLKDIPNVLPVFDALIFPSLFEGLPVTLIEAQAAGIKSFASDTITREIDCGLELVQFIPLKSPASHWAKEILRLTKKRHKKPSKKITKEAFDKNSFLISSNIKELEKIYLG